MVIHHRGSCLNQTKSLISTVHNTHYDDIAYYLGSVLFIGSFMKKDSCQLKLITFQKQLSRQNLLPNTPSPIVSCMKGYQIHYIKMKMIQTASYQILQIMLQFLHLHLSTIVLKKQNKHYQRLNIVKRLLVPHLNK